MSLLEKLVTRSVRSSAPAKLVLFGEHAVVSPYSKLGIATSLSDIRTTTIGSFLPDDRSSDHNLVISTTTSEHSTLNELFLDDFRIDPTLFTNTDFSKKSEYIQSYVDEVLLNADIEGQVRSDIRLVLKSCLCSLGRISEALGGVDVLNETNGIRYDIDSNIPLGSGLGSSASFSVSLSSTNLKLFDLLSLKGDSRTLHSNDLELINDWSYALECIFHGNPSGLDNFVCTNGGFVTLHGDQKEKIILDNDNQEKIMGNNILVVNTKIPRSTSEIVSNVRKRWESDPEEVNDIFSRIEECSKFFIRHILHSSGNNNADHSSFVEHLIRKNQSLLDELGVVGHEKFEEMFAVCDSHGFLGRKITGAGGGGCAFVFCDGDRKKSQVADLVGELESRGFGCLESSDIGGIGVVIEDVTVVSDSL